MNHYGIAVDPNTPVTGVIQNNGRAFEALYDDTLDGVDLDYIDYMEEHLRTCEDKLCSYNNHDEATEGYEAQEPSYLIGDWTLMPDETFEIDKEGEKGYAGIYRVGGNVTQVVWSKYTTRVRAMCSPCYPGQADLDSGETEEGEGYLAYTLPPDYFEGED